MELEENDRLVAFHGEGTPHHSFVGGSNAGSGPMPTHHHHHQQQLFCFLLLLLLLLRWGKRPTRVRVVFERVSVGFFFKIDFIQHPTNTNQNHHPGGPSTDPTDDSRDQNTTQPAHAVLGVV